MNFIGHQFEKPDCKRFSPITVVKRSHQGEWKWASSNEINTNAPAMPLSVRSNIMIYLFSGYGVRQSAVPPGAETKLIWY
jgi:hypothetical protein